MDSFSSIRIEKLGEDNFHVWKQKVELLLALKDLDDHLDSAKSTDEDKLCTWKKSDAKARAVIGLTLSDDHLEHVRDTESAAEMWKAICDVFQRKTLLNRINARRSFYTAKMRDDEKMLQFINRVRHLASDLKSMDAVVEEEDIAMAILCGLPERFEHLIVAIDTTIGDRPLSFEFVKSRLLQEEQRMSDRATSEAQAESALFTRRGNSRFVTCWYCNERGHVQSDCAKKKADDRERSSSEACDRHEASVAFARNEPPCDENDYTCLVVDESTKVRSDEWIVDSGASTHMTYDRSLFKTFKMKPVSKVRVGNMCNLEVRGSGCVQLELDVNGTSKKCMLTNVLYVPRLGYNLLSVSAMNDRGAEVKFVKGLCHVVKNSVVVAVARYFNGLFKLNVAKCTTAESKSIVVHHERMNEKLQVRGGSAEHRACPPRQNIWTLVKRSAKRKVPCEITSKSSTKDVGVNVVYGTRFAVLSGSDSHPSA